jgi:hypothetical protein
MPVNSNIPALKLGRPSNVPQNTIWRFSWKWLKWFSWNFSNLLRPHSSATPHVGIFRRVTVHALGAQKQNVNFLKPGITSQILLLFRIQQPATSILCNSWVYFQSKVVRVNRKVRATSFHQFLSAVNILWNTSKTNFRPQVMWTTSHKYTYICNTMEATTCTHVRFTFCWRK